MGGIKVDISANTTRLNNGLKRSKNELAAWAKSVVRKMAHAGANAARAFARGLIRNIRRVGMVAGGLLVGGIVKSISEAGRFEQYQMQFEALLGSAKAAQDRMNEIKQVDLEAPFDITEIANASRMLTVFTENAFAGTDALRMMADAASVTPRPLSEIAYWYGRAYSMIKANRPLGEAVMRLTEMGILSAEASIQLQRLSKSYSPRAQERKLAIINEEFRKFEGSAAKLVETWPGIWSVFTSATKQAFAAVGDAILPMAKIWLQEVIDKMTELRNNGTLQRWGENVVSAAMRVRTEIEGAIPKIQAFIAKVKDLYESGNLAKEFGKAVGDGIDFATKMLIKGIEKYSADFIAVGVEIGVGILQGIAKSLGRAGASVIKNALLGGDYGVDKIRGLVDEESRDKYYRPESASAGRDALRRARQISREQGLRIPLRNAAEVRDFLERYDTRPTAAPAIGANGEPIPVMIMNKPGGQ